MDKVALVTGASRGIGAAITKKLTAENFQVIGIYEKNDEQANIVKSSADNIEMIRCDIGVEKNIREAVSTIVSKYGRIDVVVNNAGISLGGKIEDYSLNDWNRQLAVNLTAKFLFSKYTIPYLRKSKGVIINISSRGGLDKYVFSDFVCYCVTNAGINNFTKALAKELKADGIRVNAVIPTVTATDRFKTVFTEEEQKEIIKAGKLGQPSEVAEMVSELIQSGVTGEIRIDPRVYIETIS